MSTTFTLSPFMHAWVSKGLIEDGLTWDQIAEEYGISGRRLRAAFYRYTREQQQKKGQS
jgi:hypothetical protein